MTFVDSNIPMYLIGAAHPHKTEAQMLVERALASQDRLITDAEVLQEIVHRYAAMRRREGIADALRLTLGLVDEVLPIEGRDVLRAGEIARLPEQWSARDAVHIAIMERHGIRRVMSFDADFDRWPGLSRIFQV
ncbi:MAG: VapC toxin family PIN domain ribonuclease [Acidobacteria bacterium]|nr:MAG: VapC toxin family PIN domain ribonuclease [Acidobacteriota bacterium]